MDQNILIGICITVIILILIVLVSTRTKVLNGFYVAPSSFLEHSGLSILVMYFTHISGSRYSLYIVLGFNNEVSINKMYDATYDGKTLIIDGASSEKINELLPSTLNTIVESDMNKLTLMSGDTAWAVLYKNHEMSSLKK